MKKILTFLISIFKSPKQTYKQAFLEWGVLLIVILFIRFYIFQFFIVIGPSMCPAINEFKDGCASVGSGNREVLFVDEFTYNFVRSPFRGEIVVFKAPYDKKDYIKRIVGVAGDIIRVKNGRVYWVNSEKKEIELNESFLNNTNKNFTSSDREEFIVPEGHVLLFGDNRNNSSDARQCFSGLGCTQKKSPYIKISEIIGLARYSIWPLKHWKKIETRDAIFETTKNQ